MHQRTNFVLSPNHSNSGRSGYFLGFAVVGLAMASTFWPGVGSSSLAPSRTAKSVTWYAGNLDEARIMVRACLAADDAAKMPSSEDCRNSLRAISTHFITPR
jgi:hypothetical protein